MRRRVPLLPVVLLLTACSTDDGRTMRPPGQGQSESVALVTTTMAAVDGVPLEVTVPWVDGGSIQETYTCDGNNESPAVSWTGGPEGTKAWAVVLTDLDSPEFAHWTVANIDATATGLVEGSVPDFAAVAMNSDAKPAYTGPCPPEGSRHRYSLAVYALGEVLEAQTGDPAAAMRAAIESAALEVTTSEFTYSR